MAEALPPERDLHICAICLEDMAPRKPRALSCLHSFCEACVQGLTKNDEIKCPTCRQATGIPEGGIANLPHNFMVKTFSEMAAANVKHQLTCQICEDTPSKSVAYRCSDCWLNMCTGCMKEHLIHKVFASHKIEVLSGSLSQSVCKLHGFRVGYWCKICEQTVCVMCLSKGKHASHEDDIICASEYQESDEDVLQYKQMLILNLAKAKLSVLAKIQTEAKSVEERVVSHVHQVKEGIDSSALKILAKLSQCSQTAETMGKSFDSLCHKLQNTDLSLGDAADVLHKIEDEVTSSTLDVIPVFHPAPFQMEVGQLRVVSTGQVLPLDDDITLELTTNSKCPNYRSNTGWKIEKGSAFNDFHKIFP